MPYVYEATVKELVRSYTMRKKAGHTEIEQLEPDLSNTDSLAASVGYTEEMEFYEPVPKAKAKTKNKPPAAPPPALQLQLPASEPAPQAKAYIRACDITIT